MLPFLPIPFRRSVLAFFALLSLLDTGSAVAQLNREEQILVAERVERFRADIRGFTQDLMNVRSIPEARARKLAYVAVTEAYRYDYPVPLVLGILLVESNLNARAVSPVGAEGLMQIMPKLWKPVLGPYFGFDLFDEATNLRYGIWISAHYMRKSKDWRKGLLRYNGCVRGTNTPNCHTYPDHVRKKVEKHARHTCPSRNFEICVVAPLSENFWPGR